MFQSCMFISIYLILPSCILALIQYTMDMLILIHYQEKRGFNIIREGALDI